MAPFAMPYLPHPHSHTKSKLNSQNFNDNKIDDLNLMYVLLIAPLIKVVLNNLRILLYLTENKMLKNTHVFIYWDHLECHAYTCLDNVPMQGRTVSTLFYLFDSF
jgi:hypothetical protein